MKEVWKDIQGYEGLYQISNLGRVKSLARTTLVDSKIKGKYVKVTKEVILKHGGYSLYPKVGLYKNKIRRDENIHRLLAIAFIDNPNNKPCINHKDGNKHNFSIDNLEWCTASENTTDAFRKNLFPIMLNSGSNNGRSKLSMEDALTIRETFNNMDGLINHRYKDLAEVFGVSRTTIFRIAKKTHWNIC